MYQDYVEEKCFSINFSEFPEIKTKLLTFINDTKCPNNVKIFVGKYFFKLVNKIYRLEGKTRDNLLTVLKKCIELEEAKDVKGSYLTYNDEEALLTLCSHFFENRFVVKKHTDDGLVDDFDTHFVLQLLNDTTLIKLAQQMFSNEELLTHFIHWIDDCNVFEQKSNILDVLLRYYPDDHDVKEIYEEMKFGKNKKKNTFYDNDQNAHDDTITKNVIDQAEKLLKKYREDDLNKPYSDFVDPRKIVTDFFKSYKTKLDKTSLESFIERLCIDNTTFGSGFQLRELFFAIMHHINSSLHKKELINILSEEIVAMKNLCSSGYVARMINTLQGIDHEYSVTIDFFDQLYAAISFRLGRDMENAHEDIMLGSIGEEHRNEYNNFVIEHVNGYLSELITDYGKEDVDKHLINAVQKLVNNCSLNYDGNILSISNVPLKTLETDDSILL